MAYITPSKSWFLSIHTLHQNSTSSFQTFWTHERDTPETSFHSIVLYPSEPPLLPRHSAHQPFPGTPPCQTLEWGPRGLEQPQFSAAWAYPCISIHKTFHKLQQLEVLHIHTPKILYPSLCTTTITNPRRHSSTTHWRTKLQQIHIAY